VLQLWWGITEQTYLYYWHHKVWAVLAAWALVALLLIMVVLIGEELWRAGYKAALRSVPAVEAPPRTPPAPVQPTRLRTPQSPEKRRFLAPPSQAFPGIRGLFSRQEGKQDQITD
jgi:hypothetical protein